MRQRPANDHEPEVPALMRSLTHHLAPPGAQVYQHLVDQAELQDRIDRVVDHHLRHAAQQSLTSAPSSFSDAVRRSLTSAIIAPAPITPLHPTPLPRRLIGATSAAARRLRHSASLTERQWRAALGGAGTLAVALVFGGVSIALDPTEVLSVLGVLSALLLSVLTVGHLVSTAVGAIASSAILSGLVVALFVVLAALWVRLVRHPVEA